MSDRKLSYEIANDVKKGRLTREDAIAEYGHIIDSETLDDVLAALEIEILDHEDGITFHVPEAWGWGDRTWSEEEPPVA